jgi:hypothetical protein
MLLVLCVCISVLLQPPQMCDNVSPRPPSSHYVANTNEPTQTPSYPPKMPPTPLPHLAPTKTTTPLPSIDLEMIETIVSMAGLKFPLFPEHGKALDSYMNCSPRKDQEDDFFVPMKKQIEMKSHDTKAAASAFQNMMEFWMKQNWCNP